MKIATFNINNINKRLTNLLDWLASARPDVVCLQELKATDSEFPQAALAQAGYGAAWRGQKSWNGVAILARDADPIVTRTALPGDAGDTAVSYTHLDVYKRQAQRTSGRLASAAVLLDLEVDLLAFDQGRQTSALNSGDVDENVRAAVVRLDEAETLGGVKPLDRSSCHKNSPCICFGLTRPKSSRCASRFWR